ncbi:transcriptional regulator [Caballeronia terrestris]|uniref:Transcriptional regulator n=2 Tax=Caballeronia terrestris TaxID=1226301 RepID=A0A158K6M6_9BURK|nr:transcriptional regulator [Caballeronia terrestris]
MNRAKSRQDKASTALALALPASRRIAYHYYLYIPKRKTPMYLPTHFEETRPEALHALIAAHPLGALVTNGPSGLDANHVPFEFDAAQSEHGILRAHVARANPVWREVQPQQDVLVIFQGATGYISPNWYPSKHEAHKQVPTYNYLVVHAHGRITVRDDEAFVRGLVARLTRKMEAGEPVPWKMGDAPRDFIDQMLSAIVGIEIEVTRLVGKAKLSQNKSDADRLGAVGGLRRDGRESALADAMLAAPPSIK